MKRLLLILVCGWSLAALAITDSNGTFLLSSPDDLMDFAAYVNSGHPSANARLTADIDMTGKNWIPIGLKYSETRKPIPELTVDRPYSGTFNGDGYTISNISSSLNMYGEGLVGNANGCIIKNVLLHNMTFTGDAAVAAPFVPCGTTTVIYCAFTGVFTKGSSVGSDYYPLAISGVSSSYSVIQKGSYSDDATHFVYYGNSVASKAATGELCYLLNQSQKDPDWFQTIGTNAYPVLRNAKKVYRAGSSPYTYYNILELDQNQDNAAELAVFASSTAVDIKRSDLQGGMYNTLCLPFALTAAQITEYFGAGCKVQELVSSSIDGEDLVITFSEVTSMAAGVPYLVQPTAKTSFSHMSGISITALEPQTVSTTYVDFVGLYSPSEVFEAGDESVLFVVANNGVGYPSVASSVLGMRAYLQLKTEVSSAAPKRAVLRFNGSQVITSSSLLESSPKPTKELRNGQILIKKQGEYFTIDGRKIN